MTKLESDDQVLYTLRRDMQNYDSLSCQEKYYLKSTAPAGEWLRSPKEFGIKYTQKSVKDHDYTVIFTKHKIPQHEIITANKLIFKIIDYKI